MDFKAVFTTLTNAIQSVFTAFGDSKTIVPSLSGFGAALDSFIGGLGTLINTFKNFGL